MENCSLSIKSLLKGYYYSYYSLYGHVEKLAQEIKKGADSVEGVEAKIWQVRETLPEEVLGKMHAPPKTDAPIITPDELAEADGVLFGFPTRFGMKPAQFKAFLDSTGGQWRTQALAGKPAGLFYSTSAQGSGQETTARMEQVKGGSPYGTGTLAGDGSRQPTELELARAFHQGKYFAGFAKKLKGTA
ncbi:putative NAD(P)H dehydrogenase (quinone) FQR1-like 2 [Hibiscus syriacus]|uniref:NAD(P)H dehydrogenase (quinone) n=1 Tax=Hibiscus syriacus TaxID=106335 RepID=A0A6A3CN46_HIBSY|nr:putative NAD(P)H dehydrogenase (quinone) FQR1-like 2 [Hibiscus syriacus]